ncbi:MAG TPA: extensin family protein [Hyphomicrobiaceae bacterium]|nr:extensin family protein [Hyphomicrobiaceae bacterium]
MIRGTKVARRDRKRRRRSRRQPRAQKGVTPPAPRVVEPPRPLPASQSQATGPAQTEPSPATGPLPADAQPTAWSDGEIIAALNQCLARLAPLKIRLLPKPAIRKGLCGTPAPIEVSEFGTDVPVAVEPPGLMNCALAVALDRWLTEVVQPAARKYFNEPITGIINVSAYTCRNRYGDTTAKLSEHALANALDISGFYLSSGKKVMVERDWGQQASALETPPPPGRLRTKPSRREGRRTRRQRNADWDDSEDLPPLPVRHPDRTTARQSQQSRPSRTIAPQSAPQVIQKPTPAALFLRQIHQDACGIFGTVLGPEANAAHRNHFHLDLAPRRRSAYCR